MASMMAPPSWNPTNRGGSYRGNSYRGGYGGNRGGRRDSSYNRPQSQDYAVVKKDPSEFEVDPSQDTGTGSVPTTGNWEIDETSALLKDFDHMHPKVGSFRPLTHCGHRPDSRPIKAYLEYGFINVDKPANPSSHEIVSWVKKVSGNKALKTGHSGTLDPKVTGSLVVCLNKATRLVKSQQKAGKEYICVLRLHGKVNGGEPQILRALEAFEGAVFQRPPLISAVKRQLRIRTIFNLKFIEYSRPRNLVTFSIDCEAGTYIRVLCVHLGYLLGVGGHMQELRRTRSGNMDLKTNLRTMNDVAEAFFKFLNGGEETHVREVVRPLEELLVKFPRIIIKDTSVGAICHGGKLAATGIVRFDMDINVNSEIVLVTTKGEAVALAYATMSSGDMIDTTHGFVAIPKRVIMDREIYDKCWGKGPMASKKRTAKEAGLLDRYGRPHAQTPKELEHLINGISPAPLITTGNNPPPFNGMPALQPMPFSTPGGLTFYPGQGHSYGYNAASTTPIPAKVDEASPFETGNVAGTTDPRLTTDSKKRGYGQTDAAADTDSKRMKME